MGTFIEGIKAVAPIVGQGLGMLGIGQKKQDKRQIAQQEKLNNLQIKGNKEMVDYQKQADLEMWNNTNFGAQKQHMIDAGLNPGLMYGMGGAGGAVTGGSGSGVSGGQATDPSGAINAGTGMGIALANMALIQSQTKKNNAEAEAISGVETDKKRTEIESLTQGITNQKTINELNEIQKDINKLELRVEGETVQDRINQVGWLARKINAEARTAFNNSIVSEETQQTKIQIIQQELLGIMIGNKKMAEEIKQKWAEVALKSKGLDQDAQRIEIQKFAEEIKANHPTIWQAIGKGTTDFIQGLNSIIGVGNYKNYEIK